MLSYLTKDRIEELARLPWNERVCRLISTVRALGLEFPTELCYKHMTTLCLLWEGQEAAPGALP